MRRVVLDANVLVSYFIDRNPAQGDAEDELLRKAEAGDIVAIVPQFVVFEVSYVLQSLYGITGEPLGAVIHDIVNFPGVKIVDECPWNRVLKMWPNPLRSLADAAIVALVTTNGYDAVATFDQNLGKRLKELGAATYW